MTTLAIGFLVALGAGVILALLARLRKLLSAEYTLGAADEAYLGTLLGHQAPEFPIKRPSRTTGPDASEVDELVATWNAEYELPP